MWIYSTLYFRLIICQESVTKGLMFNKNSFWSRVENTMSSLNAAYRFTVTVDSDIFSFLAIQSDKLNYSSISLMWNQS